MSADVIETLEREAALAALAEGLVREVRLWCADQGQPADPAAIESLAMCAAPGLLEMLGRRGFILKRQSRWPGSVDVR